MKLKDIIWLQVAMIQYISCVLIFTDKYLVWCKNKFAKQIATAIQATVYSDTNVHKSSSTNSSLKKVMNTTGQCNSCHSHKPQPWCCFLGSGNSLLMSLGQLVGTCTCRPLQGVVTSGCDDPYDAPTANFDDILKCRHLHAIVTIQVIVHNMPAQKTMSKRHMFWGQ